MSYTLAEMEAMPTIHQGQYDNLKAETSTSRLWLSRLTIEDGQPYNNQVTVEALVDGCWVTVEEYEALPEHRRIEGVPDDTTRWAEREGLI